MILPPYQGGGYGRFLIDFSTYYIFTSLSVTLNLALFNCVLVQVTFFLESKDNTERPKSRFRNWDSSVITLIGEVPFWIFFWSRDKSRPPKLRSKVTEHCYFNFGLIVVSEDVDGYNVDDG